MDDNEHQPTQLARSQSPVTIAFLFYLVTIGAIISACLRTLVRADNISASSLLTMIFVGIVIGLIGGGLVGLFYIKGLNAALISSIAGSLVGGLAGALALIPNKGFYEINLIAYAGCWLIICVMLLVARLQAASV